MNVVWLTGMPRSGTTWVSQFFAACPHVRVKFCPLFSYAFKNSMRAEADRELWQVFFDRVYQTEDEYMDQRHLSAKGLVPIFQHKDSEPGTLLIKSNRQHHLTESLLAKVPALRMLALVRDPLAVINSWINNPTEFPAGADPLQEWRSGSCRKTDVGEYWGFDDWKAVTSMHLRLATSYPDRFFLHRYEDITRNATDEAQKFFHELGIPYTSHVGEFIRNSQGRHDHDPRSVYKTRNDARERRYSLDQRIVDEICKDVANTELARFLDDETARKCKSDRQET